MGREQLLALGLGEDAIDYRIQSGRLQCLHPRVYAIGYLPLTREGHWMAAVLTCGTRAALSHHSAAALWAIRPSARVATDVTLPRRSRSSASIRRHSTDLPADEVTVHFALPVTTPPRTVFDLAATEPADRVESAIRQLEFLRLYDALSLPDLIDRHPGHRGVARLRTALDRVASSPSGRTRSPLEERFIPFLRRHCLPLPQLNAWIELGAHRHQVDCLWPAQRQIVELDSWQAHGTRFAFREDRSRDRRLHLAGYRVTRLTWAQLDDEPTALAADLRGLLGGRS